MTTVTIISKDNCPWCEKAIALAEEKGYDVCVYNIAGNEGFYKLMDLANLKTVPQIWVDNTYIGGYTDFAKHEGVTK